MDAASFLETYSQVVEKVLQQATTNLGEVAVLHSDLRTIDRMRRALALMQTNGASAEGKDSERLDEVVEANRALLHQRSQLGIKKYGGTLGDLNHPRRVLLQHALEEALDLANYLQADIQAIDRASTGKDTDKEAK